MKKHTLPLALVLALCFPLVGSAQSADLRTRAEMDVRPAEARLKLDAEARTRANASSSEARAEMKIEAEARRASSTQRRTEMQQSVVQRKVAQTARVLGATIERLERILERVESRIAKVKEAGGDTTVSEASAAQVETHLGNASTSLQTLLAIELTADSYKENFGMVREAASEVKMHLREAHRSLMEAVRSLKASVEVETSASTN